MEHQIYMNLPTHIIEGEILSWLPVKSLLRFKCVCKRWLSLIESQSFINRHYSRERDNDRLVLCRYCDTSRPVMRLKEIDTNQRFPQSGDIVELMGPQFGLFCQVNLRGDITLFNPATRVLKRVPPLPPLIFGIPPEDRIYGFGLDPLTRDYKIIVFCRPLRKRPIRLYNSTSNSWKHREALGMDSMDRVALYSNSKTFMNGVYYWLLLPWVDGTKDGVILAFDMMIERFREIQLPYDTLYEGRTIQICVRDNSLALLAFDFKQVDLWVMGKEGFWTRSFRVGPSATWFHAYYVQYYVWMNMLVLIPRDANELILVDVFTQKQRKVAFPPLIYTYARSASSVFLYKESLVSIKGGHTYRNQTYYT